VSWPDNSPHFSELSSQDTGFRHLAGVHRGNRNYSCRAIAGGRSILKIWVDADACPVVIREILFRAAQRTGTPLTLVANQPLRTPPSTLINALQVGAGFDKADDEIVLRIAAGDLAITSDIPLAAEVIAKGALVLSPRGELLTSSNIKARLNMRDFLDSMRSSGFDTGGPAALGQKDRKLFADHLDRLLARAADRPEQP